MTQKPRALGLTEIVEFELVSTYRAHNAIEIMTVLSTMEAANAREKHRAQLSPSLSPVTPRSTRHSSVQPDLELGKVSLGSGQYATRRVEHTSAGL